MTMRIPAVFVWGVSSTAAPESLRASCVPHRDAAGAFARAVEKMGFSECAVLHTCNRTEVYACGDADAEALLAAFCVSCGFDAETLRPCAYCKYGADAVYHLMRVASGLESQMLGETEIFGQVKSAYAAAAEAGRARSRLNLIFQKAFQAAKWARTETGIVRGQVGAGNVAVELARRIFGDFKRAKLLVFGAGEIAQKALAAFRSREIGEAFAASRTREHAEMLASGAGASALDLEEARGRIAEFDIVVCAMASPEIIIAQETLANAARARRGRPLFVVDLAVPRTVEDACGVSDVYVYDFADLSKIAAANLEKRRGEVEKCARALRERALRVWQTLCTRG